MKKLIFFLVFCPIIAFTQQKSEDSSASVKSIFQIFSPYYISVGSNLDITNEIQLKDLYLSAGTFTENLFNLSDKPIGINIGIRRAFYQIFDTYVGDIQQYTFVSQTSDSIIVRQENLSRTSQLQLTNTSFFISPIIPLNSNNTNLKLFLSIDFQYWLQRLEWTYLNDTISTTIINAALNEANFNYYHYPESDVYNQFIYLVGFSFPFIIENDKIAFYSKPGCGYSSVIQDREGIENENQFYYTIALELIEKDFGANFRAELLAFTKERYKYPYMSFNMAKYFDLSELIKL